MLNRFIQFARWLSWGSVLAIVILSLASYLHIITPQTLGMLEAVLLCSAMLGASIDAHATISLSKMYIFVVVLVVIGVVWWTHPVLFIYIPAISINLFLAAFFYSTLLPGREPLVTRIARIEQPDFDDVVSAYTRKVTWVWALFFSVLLVETILLIAFAPIETSLLFLNFINYLFIPILFVTEYAFRRIHLRGYIHISPLVLAARLSRRGIISVINYGKPA